MKLPLQEVGLPVSTPARSATANGSCESAVRGVRLHDLRLAFAVEAVGGERSMMASKWLGHANYTIMLNVYGDYNPEAETGRPGPSLGPTAPAQPRRSVAPSHRRSS